MRRNRQAARGFTLIELLVVIAIIAILAAILFPVFISAKVAGQTSACASNEKQIVHGIIMYADDFGGRTPPLWTWQTGPGLWGWLKNVRPYIRSRGVYLCPAFKSKRAEDMNMGIYASNYTANMGVFGTADDTTPTFPWNLSVGFNNTLSSFRRPSKMLMVIEQKDKDLKLSYSHFWMLYDTRPNPSGGPALHELKDYFPTYHSGMLNIAFVDGHVKTMRLRNTISMDPLANMWEDKNHHTANTWKSTIEYHVDRIIRMWPADYP